MLNFNLAEFTAAYGTAKQLPPSDTLEFVFCGRSNVGKSSLINKLLNRKSLARVSGVPGKTATINFYGVDGVNFVDLPGYGFAKVAKSEQQRWSGLIDAYFKQERDFALIFLLMDIRHKPSALDSLMADFLIRTGLPFIAALTKSDKLSPTAVKKRLTELPAELDVDQEYAVQIKMVPFSATTGAGVNELRGIINDISM